MAEEKKSKKINVGKLAALTGAMIVGSTGVAAANTDVPFIEKDLMDIPYEQVLKNNDDLPDLGDYIVPENAGFSKIVREFFQDETSSVYLAKDVKVLITAINDYGVKKGKGEWRAAYELGSFAQKDLGAPRSGEIIDKDDFIKYLNDNARNIFEKQNGKNLVAELLSTSSKIERNPVVSYEPEVDMFEVSQANVSTIRIIGKNSQVIGEYIQPGVEGVDGFYTVDGKVVSKAHIEFLSKYDGNPNVNQDLVKSIARELDTEAELIDDLEVVFGVRAIAKGYEIALGEPDSNPSIKRTVLKKIEKGSIVTLDGKDYFSPSHVVQQARDLVTNEYFNSDKNNNGNAGAYARAGVFLKKFIRENPNEAKELFGSDIRFHKGEEINISAAAYILNNHYAEGWAKNDKSPDTMYGEKNDYQKQPEKEIKPAKHENKQPEKRLKLHGDEMIAKLFDNYVREKFQLDQVPGQLTNSVFEVYNRLEQDFQISQDLPKEMSIERRLGIMSRIMDDVVRYAANDNPQLNLEKRVYNSYIIVFFLNST